MNTVLIVDDEVNILRGLSEGLKACAGDITFLIAENGQMALEHLASRSVDLVLTDLRMPVMDGFQLISHMNNHYPQVPVMVMTAIGTPQIESELRQRGIRAYIEKPVDLPQLVQTLQEVLAAEPPHAATSLSLISFLPLIQMERLSCRLKIKSRGREGHFDFNKGALVDAEAPGLRGEEAACAMISWDQPAIEITAPMVIRSTIHASLDDLLIKGLARLDAKEASEIARSPGDMDDDSELQPNMESAEESGSEHRYPRDNFHWQENAISTLQEDLGDALISADIVQSDGDASYTGKENPSTEAVAAPMRFLAGGAKQSGNALGFGSTRKVTITEPNKACLLFIKDSAVVTIYVNTDKSIMGIEKKIEQALQL